MLLAHQNAERLKREASVRLRAKFHAQTSFAAAKEPSAASRIAHSRSRVIMTLRDKHISRSSVAIRQQALSEIRAFCVPAVDDDPAFVANQRVLRAAVYFELGAEPVCRDLVAMHASHSYLLDAPTVGSLFAILADLELPDVEKPVQQLSPRIEALSSELTTSESAAVLSVIGKCKNASQYSSLVRSLSRTIQKFFLTENNDTTATCGLIFAVAKCDRTQGLILLRSLSARLQEELEFSANTELLVLVSRIVARTRDAPRGLLNAMCRCAISSILDLTPGAISSVLHAFHMSSHRCESVLRRLASAQLTMATRQNPKTVSLTLSALAHFYVADVAVFQGLTESVRETMNGSQAASVFHACSRVRMHFAFLSDEPLSRFCAQISDQSTASIAHVLHFAIESNNWKNYPHHTAGMLREMVKRPDRSREEIIRSLITLERKCDDPVVLAEANNLRQSI